MPDINAVKSCVYTRPGWEYQELVLGVKWFNDKKYLDLRKWMPYGDSGDKRPTGKGLMLEFSDWRALIPKIQEMLKE